MAENLSCSFVLFSVHKCDISPRYPGVKQYFPLTSCIKEVKSHLRQVKVSQTTVATEKNLILARAGLFDEDGATRTICPKHRAEFGLMWRPSRKCVHPLHGNRKNKPERGAGLDMSKEIMATWNALVPIGAGGLERLLFLVKKALLKGAG